METTHPYLSAFRGDFHGVLRWPQLDTLWRRLSAEPQQQWYIYAVGESPPETPATHTQLRDFIAEIDALLRREHAEDYCGVVYADHFDKPRLIKIFDPNNLGVACGFSDNPPLPAWVLSIETPIDLPLATAPPKNRRRWWQKIFTH